VTGLDPVRGKVLDAWAEVLGTDDFGPDDRFFDIGGTSVSALRLQTLLAEAFPGASISVVDVFRYPTVNEFAARLGEAR
jgi:hypothetical protein